MGRAGQQKHPARFQRLPEERQHNSSLVRQQMFVDSEEAHDIEGPEPLWQTVPRWRRQKMYVGQSVYTREVIPNLHFSRDQFDPDNFGVWQEPSEGERRRASAASEVQHALAAQRPEIEVRANVTCDASRQRPVRVETF